MINPKVSVIIPTYNRENLLPISVRSVLDQTYKDFELIVVDDGSTDHTHEVINSIKDSRIHYIYQDHQERSIARNAGISASRGEFISFLDSDDEYLPNKLATQIPILESNPEIGMVLSGWYDLDKQGNIVTENQPWKINPQCEYTLKDWLLSPPVHFCVSLIRRNWLEISSGFDFRLPLTQDIDLWFRLILAGCKPIWAKEIVLKFKPHIQNPILYRKNYLEVIEKAYNVPGMTIKLGISKDQAYAYSYLISAYYAFLSGDLSEGKNALASSANFDPSLAQYADSRIVTLMVTGAWSALTDDPVLFIRDVFMNLPDSLTNVRARRHWAFSHAWMSFAIRSYRSNHPKEARRAVLKAILYDPKLLFNRGMLAILGYSTFNLVKPACFRARSRQPSEAIQQ